MTDQVLVFFNPHHNIRNETRTIPSLLSRQNLRIPTVLLPATRNVNLSPHKNPNSLTPPTVTQSTQSTANKLHTPPRTQDGIQRGPQNAPVHPDPEGSLCAPLGAEAVELGVREEWEGYVYLS